MKKLLFAIALLCASCQAPQALRADYTLTMKGRRVIISDSYGILTETAVDSVPAFLKYDNDIATEGRGK